jgi:hypothetical protein
LTHAAAMPSRWNAIANHPSFFLAFLKKRIERHQSCRRAKSVRQRLDYIQDFSERKEKKALHRGKMTFLSMFE